MDTVKKNTMAKNNVGVEYRTKKSKNMHRRDFKSKNHKQNTKPSQTSESFFIKKIPDSNHLRKETPESSAGTIDSVKNPFDKKKWRMQRYSKKYKLQQWEESRKKAVKREYYRQIKNDVSSKVDVQKIYENNEENLSNPVKQDDLENENNLNQEVTGDNSVSAKNTSYRKNKRTYVKAHEKYKRLKEEQVNKREEFLKTKEERDKALKAYNEKKKQKFKNLNKKTRKGQPIMKYQMQMLLEQIQKSTEQ